MSRNRRNNHYHYAEKFDPKRTHSRSGRSVYVPFKAVLVALIGLLMFGIVTTTFGAYITENQPEIDPDNPSIMVTVRNTKASRDIAYTGGQADLAETGALDIKAGTKYFFFDASSLSWTNVQLIVGRGTDNTGYSKVYSMTNIQHTKIYSTSFTEWTDATYIRFVTGCSGWGNGNWGSNNVPSSGNYTGAYTNTGYTFNADQVYCWTPAATLSNAPSPTYASNGYNYYNYTQTIQSYTKKTGSGNYTASNDGGLIAVTTAYYVSSNTASSTSSPNNGEFLAAKTSSVTLTANAENGYRFVGWYNASDEQITTSNPYTYTVTNAREIRARFIKTYNVTITAYSSQGTYSGTAPTFTYKNSNYTSKAVDVGSSIALNSNVTTGFTCEFKTGSGSGTTVTSPLTIIAATSIYACYTLGTPTIGSDSAYATPIIVGDQTHGTSTLSKTITSATGEQSNRVYNYTFTAVEQATNTTYTYSSSAASGNSTWFDADGNFTPEIPGTYQMSMTVTETAKGLTSAAATKSFTTQVVAKPSAPVNMSYSCTIDEGEGTAANPYVVPINTPNFTVTSWVPNEDRTTGYTFKWSTQTYSYNTSNNTMGTTGLGTAGADNPTAGTDGVYQISKTAGTGSPLINTPACGTNELYCYKISLYRTYNGVDSDPFVVEIYYNVTNKFLRITSLDFKNFNASEPLQKVYAEDSGITNIVATYEAGGTFFNKVLAFSKDNISYDTVAVWTALNAGFTIGSGALQSVTPYTALPNDADHRVSARGFVIPNDNGANDLMSMVARNLRNLMSCAGPKWFTEYIEDYDTVNNQRTNGVSPVYKTAHTTVGTSSAGADRPIYYIDNSGVDFNTHAGVDASRVMAFYLDASDATPTVHYQTGQATGVTGRYRFYIPADTTQITFAHVNADNYVLPTVDSHGVLSYSTYDDYRVLLAWTPVIYLSDPENAGKTAYETNTVSSPGTGTIINLTGTLTTL